MLLSLQLFSFFGFSGTAFLVTAESINFFFHPLPSLFGQTEQVFGPKQSLFEEPAQPPKLSIQDMLGGSTAVASIEQPPDTMYLQMKRPLDMNSLEKGPPKPKQPRLEQMSLHQQLLEQVVPQQPNQPALPPQTSVQIPTLTLQKQRRQQQLPTPAKEASIYSQSGMARYSVIHCGHFGTAFSF